MANIVKKWVEVIEIEGTGSVKLERGKRVIDTKIVHETLPPNQQYAKFPEYKTIFVLECVEFEED